MEDESLLSEITLNADCSENLFNSFNNEDIFVNNNINITNLTGTQNQIDLNLNLMNENIIIENNLISFEKIKEKYNLKIVSFKGFLNFNIDDGNSLYNSIINIMESINNYSKISVFQLRKKISEYLFDDEILINILQRELKNIKICSKDIKTNYNTPCFIDIIALSVYLDINIFIFTKESLKVYTPEGLIHDISNLNQIDLVDNEFNTDDFYLFENCNHYSALISSTL
jgi:hypothetical protein